MAKLVVGAYDLRSTLLKAGAANHLINFVPLFKVKLCSLLVIKHQGILENLKHQDILENLHRPNDKRDCKCT